ncbi:MAG TPA: DUF4126 domain-containing protein [Caulobacteraceae bacterium]|jgi:hypothetical protein|nr:DUF4126 domain-containing protein [Caulobacteraceae bacterium]
MPTLFLSAFLGLGLAAAAGLRTFLPLLILAVAARLHLFGVTLNPQAGWLASTPMLVGLCVAAAAELVADKIPLIDHALAAVGTVTRPLAGALAAGAVFHQLDPATAALAGLAIGAPTALAFHGVQSTTRLVSTATSAGLANPIISLVEDVASGLLALAAIAVPVIAALAVVALLLAGLRIRRGLGRQTS